MGEIAAEFKKLLPTLEMDLSVDGIEDEQQRALWRQERSLDALIALFEEEDRTWDTAAQRVVAPAPRTYLQYHIKAPLGARFSGLTRCLRLVATTLSDADKQRIHQQVEALLPHSAYDFSQTLERIQHAVRRPCAVAAPG